MDKITNAKSTSWVTEGLSETEIKTTVELAKISARIEKRRLDMGMTQKEFANYMGVSQGMVSKWESGEYNFSINSLNEICNKLDLRFTPLISQKRYFSKVQYEVIDIAEPAVNRKIHNFDMSKVEYRVEGIA
jgi:transcriptional regulator with XRE-family HTH domain